MGGFFAPDPSSTPAPTVVAAATATDVTANETEERLATINRNRRGLAGTIATSETGLLQGTPARAGKTLLGD